MILRFPNLDTFRLVATGGLLPPTVTTACAAVAFADDGGLFVETPLKITRKAASDLTALGVTAVKAMPGEPLAVSTWLEALPVERLPAPPQLAAQAPVLFELPSLHDLPAVVGEMMRLGNDRQSYRWLAGPTPDDRRVLLRVIGPPYYTLLRALDALDAGKHGPVRAYTEASPRVWVQLGYTHEAAGSVNLAADQVVLIRPPHDWTYLTDEPFRDVYDLLQFKLPSAVVDWQPANEVQKVEVPLTLAPGNAAEVPELWVLRGGAVAGLDVFVRDADERIVQRLRFAVADATRGEAVAVLRVAPSKLPPPTVHIESAVGYRPYHKLPNLFLPVGSRLHPPLRRDVVRGLLADDPDQVVWLTPTGDGGFTPEAMPDAAFRPLEDWVEYVIETAREPLAAWVGSTRFAFESFICGDDKSAKSTGPDRPRRERTQNPNRTVSTVEDDASPTNTRAGDELPGRSAGGFTASAAALTDQKKWAARRSELEQRFLAVDGPLDHPDRIALWPQLAAANDGAGDVGEAAVCWVNALWETNDPMFAREWFSSEFRSAAGPFDTADLKRRLAADDPYRAEVRQLAAAVVSDAPATAASRTTVQKYVEVNEAKLSVRAAWLVAAKLSRAAGADVLGLARTRDRLLHRLLETGLNPEVDLPVFLRTAGVKDSERLRTVRDRAGDLYERARAWAESGSRIPTNVSNVVEGNQTAAYVDLQFAFLFAKLGEAERAARLVAQAAEAFDALPVGSHREIAGLFLHAAFAARVEHVNAGQPHTRRLPQPLLDRSADIQRRGKGVANSPDGMAHFFITRMFQESRILEPNEAPNPYLKYRAENEGGAKKAVYDLRHEQDAEKLTRRLRDLLAATPAGGGRAAVLFDVLPLAARCGGSFAAELVSTVPDVLGEKGLPVDVQAGLLERGLFLAAHFDHRELVPPLVDRFVATLGGLPEEKRYELVNPVMAQTLRSLRKFGMRDEIDRLLQRVQAAVAGPQLLPPRSAARPEMWVKATQTLLTLASGWIMYGITDRAEVILDAARDDLLARGPHKAMPQEYARLASAYVTATAQLPSEAALARLDELFARIDPTKITNSFTTASAYSRLHLNVVEETILALVSDDAALGPAGRRWLEDDEYLVRRRIHADMRRALGGEW